MTTLSIGVLLAAGAICETSRAPGGPRIAAKLYEAARNGHRIDAVAASVPTEAAASSFEAQRLLERAIEIKQGGSNE